MHWNPLVNSADVAFSLLYLKGEFRCHVGEGAISCWVNAAFCRLLTAHLGALGNHTNFPKFGAISSSGPDWV